jgi:16S rRNA (adenine1518-N6/adenine1519-N6)-dimethyltransferase
MRSGEGSEKRDPAPSKVRAKKSLGQHFLTDLGIARRIADAVSVSPKGEGAEAGGGWRCLPPSRLGHSNEFDGARLGVGCGVGENEGRGEYRAELCTAGREPDPNGSATPPAADTRLTDTARSPEQGTATPPEACAPQCSERPTDVLEIGGGMGVLTRFLLERPGLRLWGIEIDRESIAWMRERFPEFAPRLFEGDFLRFDLGKHFPGGVKIVGNFPYNISSQIFFRVLENRDLVPEVVGMVQREVAQRMAEPPGSRTYGVLSVLLQAWYDIEYLFTVSEGVFSPPPKVKSAVVRLTRNGVRELGCDETLFVKVVKAAFGQRRKMLRNSLRAVFGDFGGAEHPLFSERAEKLSVARFVELTNWVAANGGGHGVGE